MQAEDKGDVMHNIYALRRKRMITANNFYAALFGIVFGSTAFIRQ